MALLPISLGVKREILGGGRRIPSAAPDNAAKTKIFQRDKYACQYCGFISQKYQTVRPKDEAKGFGGPLVTACIYCSQCFAIEEAGLGGGAILIWLPEIAQAALHHICRAIFLGRTATDEVAEASRLALDALMVRRYEARRRIGTDDPLILATVLYDSLSDADYLARNDKLDGLRLLPLDRRIVRRPEGDVNAFQEMLTYWQSSDGPFKGILPAKWPEMLSKINTAGGRA